MVLVVTSYLQIRRKSKESKEIDRGFDRVSAGCRVDDRVGPQGNRRWSAIAHFFGYFFPFFAPTVRIPLF